MEKNTSMAENRISRPMAQRPSMQAAGLTTKEAMDIMRRHLVLIVSLTLLGVVLGVVGWQVFMRIRPRYTATALIEVSQPGLQDPKGFAHPNYTKDILFMARATKAALIKQPSFYDDLLKSDRVRTGTMWFNSYHGDAQKLRDVLKDDLSATPERDTNFVRVSMTTASAEDSAVIVNEAVRLFVASQTTAAGAQLNSRRGQLAQEIASIDNFLRTAQNSLEALAREAAQAGVTGITTVDGEYRTAIGQKLAGLEMTQSDLLRKMSQLKTTVDTHQRKVEGPVTSYTQAFVEADPVMIAMQNRLSTLRSELARMRESLGDNHRSVRQAEENIRVVSEERLKREEEITEMIRKRDYEAANDALTVAIQELEQLEDMRGEAAARQRDLEQFRIRFERQVAERDEFRRRRDELNEQLSTSRLIDQEIVRAQMLAVKPDLMSFPKAQIFIPGGGMLGLLLGIGLSFLIEMMNTLVRTPSDVKKALNVPLLGMICHAGEDDHVRGVDLAHVIRQAPYSITGECYRQFSTTLKHSSSEPIKTMLVTSGHAGDGKTCVASNLAQTIAAEGKRVLLIDANFRRPSSSVLFPDKSGTGNAMGLSHILSGKCSAADAIRSAGLSNLEVLDCGPMPGNPSEMLASTRMQQLLQQLEATYDSIIIDGPPVLLVSEARALAVMVHTTIVVLNATTTSRGAAARTVRELSDIGANVAGCVLVQAKSLKGGYYQKNFRAYEQYHSGSVVQPQ